MGKYGKSGRRRLSDLPPGYLDYDVLAGLSASALEAHMASCPKFSPKAAKDFDKALNAARLRLAAAQGPLLPPAAPLLPPPAAAGVGHVVPPAAAAAVQPPGLLPPAAAAIGHIVPAAAVELVAPAAAAPVPVEIGSSANDAHLYVPNVPRKD